jgi:hypothetical protein
LFTAHTCLPDAAMHAHIMHTFCTTYTHNGRASYEYTAMPLAETSAKALQSAGVGRAD